VIDDPLERVVVLSVRKSFWASKEAERFPRRLYTPSLLGRPSWSLLNSGVLAVRGLFAVWRRPPGLILIGSAHRLVPWFVALRRLHLLRGAKLAITNLKGLPDTQVQLVDAIIEYSTREIEARPPGVRERCVFLPLAADGDFTAVALATDGGYVFSGGGGQRDFPCLIEAAQKLAVPVRIVTFSPEFLEWEGDLPENCDVRWKMPLPEFLDQVAGATLVVVPLRRGSYSHGQTTVVQALRLGKAVVTTRNASVEDYVEHGREGLLVDPGDADGYRAAIQRLLDEPELRRACEAAARAQGEDFTYAAFAEGLAELCLRLLGV
jgi:glycosyltransferase involved in cell wall biosynthesis